MSVDGNLVAEAEKILRYFSTPARELVEDNRHGPLEARLAGGLVKLARDGRMAIISSEAIPAEAQVAAAVAEATTHIEALTALLERAIEILAERCVGVDSLIHAATEAIDAACAEFVSGGEDDDAEAEVSDDDPIFVENALKAVE